MKKSVLFVVLLSVFSLQGCLEKGQKQQAGEQVQPGSETQAVAGQLNWVYDLDAGFAAAKQAGKPVMIDFYAEWCGWCKKLDADVYTNKEVIALSEKFVNVKVDSDQNREAAQKYGVRGLPTIVFTDPDGKIVNTIVGYRDSDPFLTEMNKALVK